MDRLGAGVNAQLLVDTATVGFGGGVRAPQILRHLAETEPLVEMVEHLQLFSRQAGVGYIWRFGPFPIAAV